MRGVVRAGVDQMPWITPFISSCRQVARSPVLVINADGPRRKPACFVTTALDQGRAPVFKPDVMGMSRVTPATIETSVRHRA